MFWVWHKWSGDRETSTPDCCRGKKEASRSGSYSALCLPVKPSRLPGRNLFCTSSDADFVHFRQMVWPSAAPRVPRHTVAQVGIPAISPNQPRTGLWGFLFSKLCSKPLKTPAKPEAMVVETSWLVILYVRECSPYGQP